MLHNFITTKTLIGHPISQASKQQTTPLSIAAASAFDCNKIYIAKQRPTEWITPLEHSTSMG